MELSLIVSMASIAITAGLAYLGAAKGTASKIAALETKVDILSARVERHNGVTERVYALEVQLTELHRRLEALEAHHHE